MFWRLVPPICWVTCLITFPTSFNGFWAPKDAAWLVGSLLLAHAGWWNAPQHQGLKNPWVTYLSWWVLGLFAWQALWIQLRVAQNLERTGMIPWNLWAFTPLLFFVGSLFAVDQLIRHTDSRTRWDRLAVMGCWMAILWAVYGLAQHWQFDPWNLRGASVAGYLEAGRPTGLLGNPTVYGNFVAILMPLLLMFRPLWCLLGYLLCWTVLLMTWSVSSVIAAWTGSLVVLLLQQRWKFLGVFLMSTGFGSVWLLQVHPISIYLDSEDRLTMWQDAWKLMQQYPFHAWVGFGLGETARLTTKGYWSYGFLHNEWIQLTFEIGFIGLGLTFMACWTSLKRWWNSSFPPSAFGWIGSGVAYFLLTVVSFPLHIGSFLMLGVLIWAALESLSNPTIL